MKIEAGQIFKYAYGIYYIVLISENNNILALRNDTMRVDKMLPCQLGEYVGDSCIDVTKLFNTKK